MTRLIIGLVGRRGSGKGTVAKILKEKYAASVYRYSDVLRDILDILTVDQTRENLVELSEIVRKSYGQDVIQRALLHRLKDDPSPLLVLDGIRRIADLEGLEDVGDVKVVSVEAPVETRHERLRLRGENAGETTRTIESFRELENAPTEITIADVEARANVHIDNSGDREQLERQISDLMTKQK